LGHNAELGEGLALHTFSSGESVIDGASERFWQTETFYRSTDLVFQSIDGPQYASCNAIDGTKSKAIESALHWPFEATDGSKYTIYWSCDLA
jgi:hypothetical protein